MSGVTWRICDMELDVHPVDEHGESVYGIGCLPSELFGCYQHSNLSTNTMAQWPPWPTAAIC